MDAKALAKSKRAHTLHHNKKHHPASSKGASTKSSSGDKGKINVKPHNELPSNWDRYDLGSEGEHASTPEPSDSVVPKSKGADYAYLISEAKSQHQSRSVADRSQSEFLDDDLTFLAKGFGSLLSAKGQNMLSWIQDDDDFELEDSYESTSFEVPFLSLNLDALFQQLSKSKLSERLFIPPEVLPSELLDDEAQANAQEKNDLWASASSLSKDALTSSNHALNKHEATLSSSNSSKDFHLQTPEMETKHGETIEAANAEAELDMLLNSFGEVAISSKPLDGDGSEKAVIKETDLKKAVSSYGATASICGDIDRLLEETSDLINIDEPAPSDRVESTREDAPSALRGGPGTSKSNLEDDFDSWLDTI